MKTFTLAEARTLLPVVRSLLDRAVTAKQNAEAAENTLAALGRRIQLAGGMTVNLQDAAQCRAVQLKSVQLANEAIQEIDSIGVQVKDLDQGLLDFPFQLDKEIVLLCWQRGEDNITFWHSLEDGFRGRQPLDARFEPGDGPRPN
jgi:hypothetical protein